eukprot:g2603.t1
MITEDDKGMKKGTCWLKDNHDTKESNSKRVSGILPPSGGSLPNKWADPAFDDSAWESVDAPHDMLILGNFSQDNSNKQAFLARGQGFYRKHFDLPAEWKGSSVWIYLEGVFHETQTWLNGVSLGNHSAGYTSFWYRVDNVPSVVWGGTGGKNVLAVADDASTGTGWWYEGGGLTRHHYLVRANFVHHVPDRAWAFANVTGAINSNAGGSPADGLSAATATFGAATTVANDGASSVQASVRTAVYDGRGARVVALAGDAVTIAAGATAEVAVAPSSVNNVELWSVARPYLYTTVLEIVVDGVVVDAVNVTTGARSVGFDANTGMYLNGQHTKLRGFCDHSNFGGVGAAVPDRVNLFRAQMLRAVGGNAWRMAHNPPVPARLDIMDRLGMVAMDENRDYGGNKGQGGTTTESAADEEVDMGDLVQRDRSHPSIVLWSFCNEVGCNNESSAAGFRSVAYKFDGTRAVTQNHLGSGDHPLSMMSLDVQGMSHKHGDVMDRFHKNNPSKPIVSSECCSCLSQRGVDADYCTQPKDGGDKDCVDTVGHGGSDGVFYNNEIAQCTATQVADSDSRDFNVGTFVWSGFDYLGESRGWPQTSKARGTVGDVAGFTKESAWWIRSWWLSNISTADAGRPVLPDSMANAALEPAGAAAAATTVRIIDAWTPPKVGGAPNRTIHVYTDAPAVRLSLNGATVGAAPVEFFGHAAFSVAYAAGELKAEALDSSGAAVASHSVHSVGGAAAVRLTIDAPSPLTGTGAALVADGEDTAMLRAEIVDAAGRLVTSSKDAFSKITFTVKSGGGRVAATHSGNPAEQERGSSINAYHGLVRAFIRSSEVRVGSSAQRSVLASVSPTLGPTRVVTGEQNAALDPIVVEATVDGLPAASVSIPVSADAAHLPRAVAHATCKAC